MKFLRNVLLIGIILLISTSCADSGDSTEEPVFEVVYATIFHEDMSYTLETNNQESSFVIERIVGTSSDGPIESPGTQACSQTETVSEMNQSFASNAEHQELQSALQELLPNSVDQLTWDRDDSCKTGDRVLLFKSDPFRDDVHYVDGTGLGDANAASLRELFEKNLAASGVEESPF